MKSRDSRCVVIAEVAQAHDGSLGMAHAYIDAIANAGADAVKFQTHIASAESTSAEPWRVPFSRQDATRYQYWKRMEFTEEQWAGLRHHAAERNILFMSSPFSLDAAELLFRIGIQAWKIASGEANNPLLLQYVLDSGMPIYVSTGMSSSTEIDKLVRQLQTCAADFTLLQCTSVYPCPPERVGLNVIETYKRKYGCPIGLSDHSGTIYAGLAAATIGIAALEVHVTLSREAFGPDVPSSLTTAELKVLSDGVRFISRMKDNPVDKDALAVELDPIRKTFRKSVVVERDLVAGEILESRHLTLKKPGTGIPAEKLPELIGRSVRRSVSKGTFLSEDDVA